MNGTAHMTLGATAGLITSNTFQAEPTSTAILIGCGAVAGLLPDIDLDGKLSNTLTFSYKFIRAIAQIIGVLAIIISLMEGSEFEKWYGVVIGLALTIVSPFIKRRLMLSLTGIGILISGLTLSVNWLFLLGIYIIIASVVPHRSYTHSIVGAIFFGVIAYQLENTFAIDGVFITCLIGYIGHLIADMKFLPFNKRGVKLFLPFHAKEF
ncbi:metal-dependent hydrolase [Alkalihalobacillus sp. AL-G]|uniref:metal-dependent hydrolase n=1 Tax=Alkalihalobacillus sp. AL-G TaxID=2926399 RepID=UPI002729CBDA|nr:metal-dependent hydrolase [Alkalihalobacillus sp. AL-G]WLD94729.1 metal-dependent hydrolase [Alkalihalobacillus sp. AL-G]